MSTFGITIRRKRDIGFSMACNTLKGILFLWFSGHSLGARDLEVGFSKIAITPILGAAQPPVWIAGYDNGRQASAVHDEIWARCMLLRLKVGERSKSVALVSLDLIGYFYPETMKIRSLFKQKYPELAVDYILIASTHTHEGPDTLGLWGKNNHESGLNAQFISSVNEAAVHAIEMAYHNRQPAHLRIGSLDVEGLTRDIRLPQVIDNTLLFIQVCDAKGKPLGTMVNYSCHPEALGANNTQITSDYPHFLRESLEKTIGGTALFFVGSIGGLLTPADKIRDPQTGRAAPEDSWRKAQIIGETLASKVVEQIKKTSEVQIDRLNFHTSIVYIPVTNDSFRMAAALKLYQRQFYSNQKPDNAMAPGDQFGIPAGIPQGRDLQTEVAVINLGPAQILGIPGEIYPEIVVGGIQKPQDPAADFPGAPREEPSLRDLMPSRYRFVLGLANDEIGYIIPKSQWDVKPPFAYSLKNTQYGEVNSCGYETAPVIYQALRQLLQASNNPH
jgi:hypothetical protein